MPAWPAHRRAGDHAAEPHGVLARIGQSAELLEQAPQRGVGASQVGLLLNGLAEARLGLVEPTQLLENVTENGQREWEIGAQSDSLPAERQGLRRLAQFEQHLAQVALGLCRDRVELHGLAKMLDRRNPVSQKPQRVGQVVVGGGEAGPEPDRFAEMGDRLVHGSQVDQCCPEITLAFGMIGLKLQGGPIGVDGAIKLPERPERRGEGGVISRLGGADRDRPAHKRGHPTGISPLERDQPQEMESIGMIGRLSQGRLIQARGLLEPALPVVLDRRPQIDRHGPGSSGRVIWTERARRTRQYLTTIVCGKPRGRSPRGTWRRWSTTWAGSHAVKRSSISWTLQFRRKPPGRRRGQGRRKTRCGLKLVGFPSDFPLRPS